MSNFEILISLLVLFAIIGPLMALRYTSKIAQVDKHKYQNWR